jgi:hypothetical protein
MGSLRDRDTGASMTNLSAPDAQDRSKLIRNSALGVFSAVKFFEPGGGFVVDPLLRLRLGFEAPCRTKDPFGGLARTYCDLHLERFEFNL